MPSILELAFNLVFTYAKSSRKGPSQVLYHLCASYIFSLEEKINLFAPLVSYYALCYLDTQLLICWKHPVTDSFQLVFPALQLMSLESPHIFLTVAISQAGPSEVIIWPQQNHCIKGISSTLLSEQLDGRTLLSFADLKSYFRQPSMKFLVLTSICLNLAPISFSDG